jgi:hypothetical protein
VSNLNARSTWCIRQKTSKSTHDQDRSRNDEQGWRGALSSSALSGIDLAGYNE